MVTKPINEVLKECTESLVSLSEVVGTAQGLYEGKPCIKVYVIQNTPELSESIPEVLEGYSVKIEETGPIKAL